MVREGGLEPPRPEWTLEPESSESTNSTTRAFESLLNIASSARIVNIIFTFFRKKGYQMQEQNNPAMRKIYGFIDAFFDTEHGMLNAQSWE